MAEYAGAYGMMNAGVQIATRKLWVAIRNQDWEAVKKLTAFLDDLGYRAARLREHHPFSGKHGHDRPNIDITEVDG